MEQRDFKKLLWKGRAKITVKRNLEDSFVETVTRFITSCFLKPVSLASFLPVEISTRYLQFWQSEGSGNIVQFLPAMASAYLLKGFALLVLEGMRRTLPYLAIHFLWQTIPSFLDLAHPNASCYHSWGGSRLVVRGLW